jgi:hypothetical protein
MPIGTHCLVDIRPTGAKSNGGQWAHVSKPQNVNSDVKNSNSQQASARFLPSQLTQRGGKLLGWRTQRIGVRCRIGTGRPLLGFFCPVLAQNLHTAERGLVIFASQPYRHGHGDDSLCRFIDRGFPFSQPRRARTQACRSSASVGRSAPTTPRPTSAFIPGSTSVGVALPDLAPGHRRDGTGQARNRGRVASQGLPVLLALAVLAQNLHRAERGW